jgi:hypothetical protein
MVFTVVPLWLFWCCGDAADPRRKGARLDSRGVALQYRLVRL